jgi:hypothetical protein
LIVIFLFGSFFYCLQMHQGKTNRKNHDTNTFFNFVLKIIFAWNKAAGFIK